MKFNIKEFLSKCVRVWKILKKPSKDEFLSVAKIAAIGILAIGLLGFFISVIMQFLTK
jgi:protein transport protein SEC61 subunit gamma-like protein